MQFEWLLESTSLFYNVYTRVLNSPLGQVKKVMSDCDITAKQMVACYSAWKHNGFIL